MIKPIGVVLMIVAFLLVQPDFGSSALLLAITGTMLVLGGVRLMRIAAPALILLPVMGWIAMSASYRVRRLTTFMDPWKDQQGDGYQLSNALMAIGRGEWTGVGLGASVQKLDYLPEVHTDFIFSVIAEELGFLGVCAVLALYATLAWSTLNMLEIVHDERSQILGIPGSLTYGCVMVGMALTGLGFFAPTLIHL